MSGDGLAYRMHRAQGHDAETADRMAGEGPIPVVPVGKMGRTLEGSPALARMTAELAAKFSVDPAALYARATGCSLDAAKMAIDKAVNHLQERETYYEELDAALEVPTGIDKHDTIPGTGRIATYAELREAAFGKALTPGEVLSKAKIVEKIQDAIAGRRAEKERKRVLAEKKGGNAKGSGGWEKGPRGGTRKKVGGRWVYRGKGGEGGESGGGEAVPGDEGSESPSPKVKGRKQTQIPSADAINEQGRKLIEAVRKKSPEHARDLERALTHVVAGLRQRQKGRGTPESDKNLLDALKEFGRSFNSSAAPGSVLGPDLAGLLEASAKAEAIARKQLAAQEKQEKLEQDTKHATSKVVAAAQKVAEAVPKGEKKDEGAKEEKVEKAIGLHGAPIGGSSPRDETPAIPDYQEIYHQPSGDAAAKREAEARAIRRAADAKRLSGVYGFHGTDMPHDEPVLRFVIPHDGPAPKPRAKAADTQARRDAGMPYKPKSPGEVIHFITDAGRVPRSPDRREDGLAPDEKRPSPRLVAKMVGDRRGGKYIKRVPYTDGKGRRRYRYYYSESAVARDVHAEDEIRVGKRLVKVESVAEDGTITLVEPGGKKLRVSPDEWGAMLTRHYGARYTAWAEKRAAQSVNAVLRHVPKRLLKDLQGETDEERLADLAKRVPAVYAKLRASFDRAGVNPFRAKTILAQTLERRGWAPEARAAVVGSVITQRTGPTNVMEVIRGAENLAGGAQVEAKHVGALIELRGPRDTDLKARIDSIAQAAEKELATLSKVLAQASEGDAREKAEALADVLASSAIQKLAMLAQAFPGLRDRAIEPMRELLLGAPSVAPAAAPKEYGADATLFVAGEGGKPKALRARYRLMEASTVKASHDPTAGFRKRDDYPGGVQERAYHRDRAEQEKVIRNAQTLEPAIVVNTNPDAVNGPPMVTPEGIALGGNSRTMSMQSVYAHHPEKAEQLKQYLRDHAHEFGLTPEDVDAMKAPMLVREVAPEGEKHTPEEMRLLVRQMNESFTQGMDPRTMQVALGRKLDDSTLETLGRDMQDGETLSQFLASPRSEHFINSLARVGVIDARNQNQYLKKNTGKRKELNEDGKTLVERILVGRLVGDADVLSNTQASIVSNLARSVPYMIQAKGAGAGYDISNDMREAIESLNMLQHQQDTGTIINKMHPKMTDREYDSLFGQMTILGSGTDIPAAKNPRAKLLLEVLIRKPGPVQMASVFKDYAEAAQREPEGQGGMFGGPDPQATLKRVVDAALKGDRGGKAKAEPEPKKDEDTGSLF